MTNTNTAPFPTDQRLIGIAQAHTNPDWTLIADQVLPRIPEIGVENFKWFKFDLAQGFTVPDTRVGRTSRPNELEFTGTEEAGFTQDYGLDSPIPKKDVDEAAAAGATSPVDTAVNYLTGLVKLAREVRVANKVFNPAVYAAAHKTALVGSAKFSDYADSDPVTVLETALETPIMRPNYIAMGEAVWRKIKRHPKLAKAIYGNNYSEKKISRADLAEYLEIKDIFVGQGRLNIARPGQAQNLQFAWGKHICAFYRDQAATNKSGLTFGYSVPRKGFQAGTMPDATIGVEGGVRVRAWESVAEVVAAPHLGYLIQDAVA